MAGKTAPTSKAHETLVAEQFGARAAAYVASAVHASGEDLDQAAALARAWRPARALDLGCGGGHLAFHLAPHAGAVVAYDLSAEMLEAVAGVAASRGLANLSTRQGAVEALPFADASFDLVASRYSAHHWRDVGAALREARRVLAPGGHALFMDAITPGRALVDTWLQSLELLRDPSHLRNYTEAEWRQALGRAGFAPGQATHRRVRLDFASWVKRMSTPESHVQAIRSLQARAPREVAEHFAIEPDGSFMLDTMTIEAAPA